MNTRRCVPLFVLLLGAIACGGEGIRPAGLSKTPVSIRGWVDEIVPQGAPPVTDATHAYARKVELLQSTSVSVEGVPYASGGISETGAFIIFDVPPGQAIVNLNAPGANALLHVQNIPPSADVFVPYLSLQGPKVVLMRPDRITVRVPSPTNVRKRLTQFAIVEGVKIPIDEVPVIELRDRRDYPDPHGSTVIPRVR